MKHARKDYQRIQDPLNLIPENEPVFLLRGQDVNILRTLMLYRDLVQSTGDDFGTKVIVESIEQHITAVRNWQATMIDNGNTPRRATLPDEVEMQKIQDSYHALDTSEDVRLLQKSNEELKESLLLLLKANELLQERNNELLKRISFPEDNG